MTISYSTAQMGAGSAALRSAIELVEVEPDLGVMSPYAASSNEAMWAAAQHASFLLGDARSALTITADDIDDTGRELVAAEERAREVIEQLSKYLGGA